MCFLFVFDFVFFNEKAWSFFYITRNNYELFYKKKIKK